MMRINTPTVVSEIFDNEIVILNLASGTYYSLNQRGIEIWKLLQAGFSVEEMNSQIAAQAAVPIEEVAQVVQAFLITLAQENLIVVENHALQQIKGATGQEPSVRGHFSLPTLTKFTDMQELLLLDPIHDVTETGWPHVTA